MKTRFVELPCKYEKAKRNQELNAEIEAHIAKGGKITVLPDYEPKPRPEHTVRIRSSKRESNLSPRAGGLSGQQAARHRQWVDHLKLGHQMTVSEVRQKFKFTQPIRTAEVINKRANRTVIKRVNAVKLGRTTTLFKYNGDSK